MRNLLKIEELFLFGLALFLFSGLDYGWGASRYALLFLAPDLSMLGYLLSIPWLMFAGTILLGHSSLDRVFGYGLKHDDAFQNTHLGVIGK